MEILLYRIEFSFLSLPVFKVEKSFSNLEQPFLFPSATKLDKTKFREPVDRTIVQFEREIFSRERIVTSSTTFPSLPIPLLDSRFFFRLNHFKNFSLFFPFFSAPPKIFRILVTFVNRSSADTTLFFSSAHLPPEMPLIPVTRVLHRVCAQF